MSAFLWKEPKVEVVEKEPRISTRTRNDAPGKSKYSARAPESKATKEELLRIKEELREAKKKVVQLTDVLHWKKNDNRVTEKVLLQTKKELRESEEKLRQTEQEVTKLTNTLDRKTKDKRETEEELLKLKKKLRETMDELSQMKKEEAKSKNVSDRSDRKTIDHRETEEVLRQTKKELRETKEKLELSQLTIQSQMNAFMSALSSKSVPNSGPMGSSIPLNSQTARVKKAKKPQCVLCHTGTHATEHCPTFPTGPERKAVMIRNDMCLQCLLPLNGVRVNSHEACVKKKKKCQLCKAIDHRHIFCDYFGRSHSIASAGLHRHAPY